jgi:hypothetical protein
VSGTYNGTHWDGNEYELPGFDAIDVGTDEGIEAFREIVRQVKPGAVVTYPDGSRYRVARKPHRFVTCVDTGRTYRVMKLKKLDP